MTDLPTGIVSRQVALDILCDHSSKFKKELFESAFNKYNLAGADRRLAMELVHGVVRHSLTLTHVLRQYSFRLPTEVAVRNALMIGLYQLLFMERVPVYAAIDTTVELLKQRHRQKQTAYVNAVLRKIQRETERVASDEQSDKLLPLQSGKAVTFTRPVFPSPQQEQSMYWSLAYSYPFELVKRWRIYYGDKVCRELLQSGNLAPSVFLRLRPGADRERLLRDFTERNVKIIAHDQLLQMVQGGEVELLPGVAAGECVVTGPVSMQVVEALEVRPGLDVLDVCAAPGGKTLQIADLLAGQGEVVACDIAEDRLLKLDKLKQSLGLKVISLLQADGNALPTYYHQAFDRVLVDAPCSNTAVLGKRAEARWRFGEDNLRHLQKLQLALLESGARAVKPGGLLVYSTCSLEPEENRDVVEKFRSGYHGFTVVEHKQVLPLPPYLDGATWYKLAKN